MLQLAAWYWIACTRTTPPPSVPDPAPDLPLAITLDDLPFAGSTARGESPSEALAAIADTLSAAGAPATGFVVCDRRSEPSDLTAWREAGLSLANHSSQHRSVDNLGAKAFLADAADCRDQLTALTGSPPRYFRYPYLQTGATRELRDEVAAGIAALGHTRAPVSIDVADWVLAEAYAAAVDADDPDRATALADAYVAQVLRAAQRYRRVAQARVGRDVAQVLLLHANALSRDHLDRVLDGLQRDGFRFVTLDEALQDEVYAEADDWVDPVGASWLLRLAPADLEGWGWDRGQTTALQLRFGLREEPDRQRIGPYLRAHRLPVDRAWRITHTEVLPANALIVQAPNGQTVLADTPFTEPATRDLLDWMEARFGAPPALATIGHFHLDASAGVGPLQEAGVRLAVADETVGLLRDRGPSMQASLIEAFGAPFEGWTPVVPPSTFTLAQGERIDIGGMPVEVRFPGPAHSPDNVVTWFPDRRLLFGGCMVKGGDDLGNLGDADVPAYPTAIKVLQALEPAVVVPGHGDRIDPEQLAHTLRLLQARPNSAE